jgi:hypothetical protein
VEEAEGDGAFAGLKGSLIGIKIINQKTGYFGINTLKYSL